MAESSVLTAVLRRDRLVVITALVTVIGAAWIYVLVGAGMGMSAFEMTAMTRTPAGMAPTGGDMPGMVMGEGPSGAMQDMAMAAMAPMAWTPGYAVLMFFMWWIMMMAMMLPSAAPMILLFTMVNRKQREKGAPYVPIAIFAAGYVLVWGAFSLAAVAAQWGLEHSGLLT